MTRTDLRVLLLPDYWTPEQALAVFELIDDLRERHSLALWGEDQRPFARRVHPLAAVEAQLRSFIGNGLLTGCRTTRTPHSCRPLRPSQFDGACRAASGCGGRRQAPSRPMLPSCSRQSRTSPSGGAARHPCTAAARNGCSHVRSGRE